MALKWIDGAEIYGTNYFDDVYLAISSMTRTTGQFRVAPGVASINFGSSGFATTPSLGLQNTWIVGFGVRAGSANWQWRLLSGATVQCTVQATTLGSGFTVRVTRGTSTVIATSSTELALNTWHHIEFKLTVRTGTDGAYEVRYNESNILSGSGVNLANAGTDGADGHSFGYATSTSQFDDINIKDSTGTTNNDFNGDSVCFPLFPTGDGHQGDFTPSTGGTSFDDVDDDPTVTNPDTDYISSDTVNHEEYFTYGDTPSTGVGTIFGINISTRGALEGAGSRTLRARYYNGSTEFDAGDDMTFSGTTNFEHPTIVELNPDTAAAWQKSELDAAEFGVQIVT